MEKKIVVSSASKKENSVHLCVCVCVLHVLHGYAATRLVDWEQKRQCVDARQTKHEGR